MSEARRSNWKMLEEIVSAPQISESCCVGSLWSFYRVAYQAVT
jgi:hypothetical protein